MKLTKMPIEEVLFAFYGKVLIYENVNGEYVGSFLYPPKELLDWEHYDIESEKDDSLDNIQDVIEELHRVVIENKDKYYNIKIKSDRDADGYESLYRIVGIRKETDEEFAVRVKAAEELQETKAKQKLDKQQRIKENKLKMLAKLKEELE